MPDWAGLTDHLRRIAAASSPTEDPAWTSDREAWLTQLGERLETGRLAAEGDSEAEDGGPHDEVADDEVADDEAADDEAADDEAADDEAAVDEAGATLPWLPDQIETVEEAEALCARLTSVPEDPNESRRLMAIVMDCPDDDARRVLKEHIQQLRGR